uniref:Uncharacterized protein n=1 Tax=Zea mays TaxID=4577 RepID=B6TE39_MAIZE|nr:hypothetical protein [Zea mays]ACN26302.1 unknown [Zea mays]
MDPQINFYCLGPPHSCRCHYFSVSLPWLGPGPPPQPRPPPLSLHIAETLVLFNLLLPGMVVVIIK